MTIDSTMPRSGTADASALRGLCSGAVHLPGDPGYDTARMPWNVAVDQRPAAVAYPATADDVVELVLAASAAGLRIAPQGTGHNPGPLAALDDVVLLRTTALTAVSVDPISRSARAEAGALWIDVVEAAAEYGLAALHGSSPDVGVVGYSLGGGMGWYARNLGLQTNALTAVELVLADGSFVRADAHNHPDLFWALRGGGGNFGVVTAIEFDLFDIATAYAGMLVWDWAAAERVLNGWADWAVDAPDEVTTSWRILQIPPIPEMPAGFRGRKLVVIDGAVMGDEGFAEQVLAPLRDLKPELDTFASVPAASLVRLHLDPEGPTPFVSDSTMLSALPPAARTSLLAAIGPQSGSTLLLAELRQVGGALGRAAAGAGALSRLGGQFVFFAGSFPMTPEIGLQALTDAANAVDALQPWANGQYLNFAEAAVDCSTAYSAEAFARLQGIRNLLDPDGLFVANHRI